MDWLLTTNADTDLAELARHLEGVGCTLEPDEPTPLDGGQQVVRAQGPRDLPARLEASGLARRVEKVSPSSPMDLY